MEPTKQRIGDILIQQQLITREQLDEALRRQQHAGGTLGEHLIQLGMLSDRALLDALSAQTRLTVVDLSQTEISPAVLQLVRRDTVAHRHVLPIRVEGKSLVLGMVDPTDTNAIADVEFESGHDVQVVLLSVPQYRRALEHLDTFGYATRPLLVQAVERIDAKKTLNSMLAALVEWNGQDLHLSAGAVPAVRVDNEMRRLNLPASTPEGITRMVGEILSPSQRKAFDRDLELDLAYALPEIGRFRCNVYSQKGTLAFTARHVRDDIPSRDQLHLPEFLDELALKRQGLILVVGPNGHGKTTTLAYLIDVINNQRNANIITIEDPVEYIHYHKRSNVNQREVGTDTHSFASGLRSVFRQNPDVIVIGEMRDPESIAIALSAAQTGHLVMASVHALNATAAIDRILDSLPSDKLQQIRTQLAESLLAIFSQRLVARASGTGRVLAWEKVANSHRVAKAIRDADTAKLRSLVQSNLPELEGMDRSLARLAAEALIKPEEGLKWAEDAKYYQELIGVFQG